MPVPETTTAEVIADRYLTSPAGLRTRPFGPLDALDTHAGRAAQVRIVFLPGEWPADAVAERVAAWCGVGTAGVIGILDFGMHEGRAYVVLPPSLGVPLERWKTMRRPSAVDAATLALSFGRLVEAVSAAGFVVDTAEPCDFAVGPGPTPFLDVPLLGAAVNDSVRMHGDGQAVIAQIFRSTVAQALLPADLSDWAATAAEAGFGGLAGCLDELERVASSAHDAAHGSEPVGIAGVFDGPAAITPRRAKTAAPRGRRIESRWVRGGITLLLLATTLLSYRAHAGAGQDDAAAAGRPLVVKPAAVTHSQRTPVVKVVKSHKSHKPRAHRSTRQHRHISEPTTPVVSNPPTASTPPTSSSGSSGDNGLGVAVGGGSRSGGSGSDGLGVAVGNGHRRSGGKHGGGDDLGVVVG